MAWVRLRVTLGVMKAMAESSGSHVIPRWKFGGNAKGRGTSIFTIIGSGSWLYTKTLENIHDLNAQVYPRLFLGLIYIYTYILYIHIYICICVHISVCICACVCR